ncbi:hypothetical protein LTR94_033957, partial [Friedmanniomyces endolithicus]
AEQAADRGAAPAERGAAVRPAGDQVDLGLPDGRRLRLGRRQHDQVRHRQLRGLEHPGSAQPHPGRGQHEPVRHPVRDARLARPGQADQLPTDPARRGRRHPRPERADRGRRAGRPAGRPRPDAERHHQPGHHAAHARR